MRRDHLGVGAAVARQQPRALELQRERRQRVREHVVHVAREPAALGQRGGLGVRRARLAQLLDQRLGLVAAGAQLAHQPHDQEPRDDREQQPADLVAGLVDDRARIATTSPPSANALMRRAGQRGSRIAAMITTIVDGRRSRRPPAARRSARARRRRPARGPTSRRAPARRGARHAQPRRRPRAATSASVTSRPSPCRPGVGSVANDRRRTIAIATGRSDAAAGARQYGGCASLTQRHGRARRRACHRRAGGTRLHPRVEAQVRPVAPMTRRRSRSDPVGHDHELLDAATPPRPTAIEVRGLRKAYGARAGARRRRPHGPPRRGARPARPQRRRQDHARRDPRGPPRRRRGRRSACSATTPRSASARSASASASCCRRRGSTRTSPSREAVELYGAAYPNPRPVDEVLELVGLGRAARRRAPRRSPAASAAGSTSRSASPATPS